MATNRVFVDGQKTRSYDVSDVTGSGAAGLVTTGDPVAVGSIPGVALTTEDADGKATVQLDGSFDLEVEGINDAGNVAVAVGDWLYFHDGEDPPLNKDTDGVPFGFAEGAADSAATATIQVQIVPSVAPSTEGSE